MKPANAADKTGWNHSSFTIFVIRFVLNSGFPLLFLQGVQSHSCLCILNLKETRTNRRLNET